jgi:hypothetical protein
VPVRRDEPREILMRLLLRPFGHLFRWPLRISVFLVRFMHHLAAFFAWIWMFVHVIGTMAQAGLQAGRLWETRVLMDIWEQGTRYFSDAGGLGWQKILAFALIPALLLALRNAYLAYEQFHAWLHHGAPQS